MNFDNKLVTKNLWFMCSQGREPSHSTQAGTFVSLLSFAAVWRDVFLVCFFTERTAFGAPHGHFLDLLTSACFPFLVLHKIAVHRTADGNLRFYEIHVYLLSVCLLPY